jgi:hypothetical protein
VSGSGERIVRDLNDRLYALLRDIKASEGKFDCECGEPDCRRTVTVSLRDYAAMRAFGGRGVFSPEHYGPPRT